MNQVFFSTALRLALTGWPLVSCKRCLPLPLYKQHQSRRHLAGCISHPLPVRGWDMEEARRVCTHKTNCNSKDKRQLPLSRREQRSIENSGRHWDCCHRAVWARSACGPICGALPDDRDHGCEGAASLSDSLCVRTEALCHGESGATTAPANYWEKLHVISVVTFFPAQSWHVDRSRTEMAHSFSWYSA